MHMQCIFMRSFKIARNKINFLVTVLLLYFSLKLLTFFQAYKMPEDATLMELGEVQRTWNNIPWADILNAVFNPIKIKVSNNDIIHISCPKCLASLNDYIRNTSIKFVHTYSR